MPKVKHTILPPYRNADVISNTNSMYKIQDGTMQQTKEGQIVLAKRFGATSWVDLALSDPIDGVHWFESLNKGIVVSGAKVYTIDDSAGATTDITADAPEYGQKCTFAEVWDAVANETRLFIASGGQILWTNGTTTAYATGNIAPTRCTHVAQVDTYLCFNDLDTPGFWKHSVVEEPTNLDSGSGARTMTAQRIPDDIVAVFALSNKLYVCGTRSIEVWQNVGDTIPFASLNLTIESGLNSGTSVSTYLGTAMLFSDTKRLIRLDGYTPNIISEAYQAILDASGSATSIETEFVAIDGGKVFLLIRMQDQNTTVVYDVLQQVFYEWGKWNSSTNQYSSFYGRCYAYMKSWGLHVIGDATTAKVYKVSDSYYDDNGDTIKSYFEFGNVDHGSSTYKISNSLYVNTKRGTGLSGNTAAVAALQWRDDGNQPYGNIVDLDLGVPGDAQMPVRLSRMGRYRSRQFKITMGQDSDFVFLGFEEDVYDSGRI